MAKFDLKFIDNFGFSYIQTKKAEVNLYSKDVDVINIEIGGFNNEPKYWVNLDKSTAIKFAKTLRTEINKITEVNNE